MIINVVNSELGEFIYFPISQSLGKLKAHYGDPLSNCYFFWVPLHSLSLALYLPNFMLMEVRAHLGKDASGLESEAETSGLQTSSYSEKYGDIGATFTFLLKLFGEERLLRKAEQGGVRMALKSAACRSIWQHDMLCTFTIS